MICRLFNLPSRVHSRLPAAALEAKSKTSEEIKHTVLRASRIARAVDLSDDTKGDAGASVGIGRQLRPRRFSRHVGRFVLGYHYSGRTFGCSAFRGGVPNSDALTPCEVGANV